MSPCSSSSATCSSWYETTAPAVSSSSISFRAGLSRMSPIPGLYATPSTSTFDPFSERCLPWFSACEISERQCQGMFSFTLPASSMNSV